MVCVTQLHNRLPCRIHVWPKLGRHPIHSGNVCTSKVVVYCLTCCASPVAVYWAMCAHQRLLFIV